MKIIDIKKIISNFSIKINDIILKLNFDFIYFL